MILHRHTETRTGMRHTANILGSDVQGQRLLIACSLIAFEGHVLTADTTQWQSFCKSQSIPTSTHSKSSIVDLTVDIPVDSNGGRPLFDQSTAAESGHCFWNPRVSGLTQDSCIPGDNS